MIDIYSDVRLVDGRAGTIVEVYQAPPGYCIEFDNAEIGHIRPQEIAEVIRGA